jgi:DNA-binding NarL/FixJ family response regulator
MSRVGVLTVHHDEKILRAARVVVSTTPGFEEVGVAATAEEALELARALRPSLALVGVDMPGIDGFETSRRLVAALPDITVVLLCSEAEPLGDALGESQAAGALGVDALTPTSVKAFWDVPRTE